MNWNKYALFLLCLSLVSFVGCSNKEDNFPEDIQLKKFVWTGMNAYYKWQSSVPDLGDQRFANRAELNDFLSTYNSPEDLFKKLRYKIGTVDRFSWMVSDYVELENNFLGIDYTSGIEFSIKKYGDDTERVYALVSDVLDNSDAKSKGIKRGDIIYEVNDTQLDTSNYKTLFENSEFTVTIANGITGNIPTTSSNKIDLTKTMLEKNPIRIAKTIDYSGKKIGYLLYNQFSSNYNQELNNTFLNFKNENIEDLIIDLRFNGGGSVETATYLASMITGQFTDKVFAKQVWNEKVMKNIDNKKFINKFVEEMDSDEAIHSLKLTKVYFITSERTASASELLINGLKPYIDVKLVGTQTTGKQVGSITLYDSDNFRKKGENFNTSHKYALQPLVFEIMNVNGENNSNGYIPDIVHKENLDNFGKLGDVTEGLLNKTLKYITGQATERNQIINDVNLEIWNSDMEHPNYQRMYLELK